MTGAGVSLEQLPPAPEGSQGWPWTEATPPPLAAPPPGGWPRITLVTPSFNQAGYLEETLRSVLLQGYPDLEYIVVDGGSTDGSVEIIRRYEPHLAWWTSEQDRGQTHAINKGFERATGQLRGYLNSDDLLEPGALLAVADAYAAGADWIAGNVRCFAEAGEPWPFPRLPGRGFTRWFLSCPISQPGVFWSAALHRDAGPFREDLTYVMDYEFWLRLRFATGREPLYLDRNLARYRMHPASKSVASQEGMGREMGAVARSFEARLTRFQRARLWLARRHRRARVHAGRALAHFRSRSFGPAAGEAVAALRQWPLLFLDAGALVALVRRLRSPAPPAVFPDVWPEDPRVDRD